MGWRASLCAICIVLILINIAAVPVTIAAEPKPAKAQPAKGPTVARKAHRALDLTIGKDGSISGKLVDPSGNPLVAAKLVARRNDQQPVAAKSDDKGAFRFNDMRPGVYSIAYGDRSMLLRAWDANLAPPASKPGVLLVNGEVKRGQIGDLNPFANSLTAQTFAVGVLTAAVAVPVAIGLDEPSGS